MDTVGAAHKSGYSAGISYSYRWKQRKQFLHPDTVGLIAAPGYNVRVAASAARHNNNLYSWMLFNERLMN